MKKPWYEWIQSIDPRIIYLVVFIVVSVPFFVPIRLPMRANEPVENLHKKVEEITEYNKTANRKQVILFAMEWAPSVQAECWPAAEVMVEHCFENNIPFIIMSMYSPEGPMLTQKIAEKRAEEFKKKHGVDKVYGVDWVNFGYKRMGLAAFLAFVKDLYSQIAKDIKDAPIRNVPMMRDIESLRDMGLVFYVSGSGGIETWIQYMQPETGVDISTGCTAIIGPSMYPFLDSGQMIGMMAGLSGAAQYEHLVGYSGRGTRGMGSQNLAHFWIIAMMILGNVGYIFQRRRERKEKQQIEMAGDQ
jgi:hypothetical protein